MAGIVRKRDAQRNRELQRIPVIHFSLTQRLTKIN
jgi:hypothetical protein